MFWDNLQEACKKNHIKVTPLLNELKLSSGNISRWRKGGAVTSDALLAIAERLQVSTDYLLTGKDFNSGNALSGISYDEQQLIKMYRSLSAAQQGRCYSYIQGMYDSINRE